MEARMVLAWAVLTTLGGCCPGAETCGDKDTLVTESLLDDTGPTPTDDTGAPPLPCRPDATTATTEPTGDHDYDTALAPDTDPDAEVVLVCVGPGDGSCEGVVLSTEPSDADSFDWFTINANDGASYAFSTDVVDVTEQIPEDGSPLRLHIAARRGDACDGVDVAVFAQPGFSGGRRTVINPSFVSASTSKSSCNFVAGISGCVAGSTQLKYTGTERGGTALDPFDFNLTKGTVTNLGFATGTTWSYDLGGGSKSGTVGSLPGGYSTGSLGGSTQFVAAAWSVKVGGTLTVLGTKYTDGTGFPGTTYTTSCKLGGKGTVTFP